MDDAGEGLALSAAACARWVGLSVRALRLYEQRGLLRPRRTAQGWRIYGRTEIARLVAIVTLRSLGLSLAETALAMQSETELGRLLDAKAASWRDLAARARRGLAMTEAARCLVRERRTMTVQELCDLLGRMKMTDLPKAMMDAANALYTPEEQGAIAARKAALMEADATHGTAAWTAVIAEVRQLIAEGADPASARAREVAERWAGLVRAFSGGDAAVEAKAGAFWGQLLEADPTGRELPFGKAEAAFVRQALAEG